MTFMKNHVVISRNGTIAAKGTKQANAIYRMFFVVPRVTGESATEVNLSESVAYLKLWHERFGRHAGSNTIKRMVASKLVSGIKISRSDEFFCEPCQYGKAHRLPFHKSVEYKKCHVGERFHSDVCGPMSVESLGGARYFVVFIDDASGYKHVYFVRSKDQVAEKYQEFATLVKNKFDRAMKILRSDNGLEYVNATVKDYLAAEGIEMTNSAPYTPEQNGKSERANRTIVEAARRMLKATNLPIFLWAETVNTAVYLQNRIVSRSHPEKTPFEFWNDERPRVQHLRVFGCSAFVHVLKQFRRKFDEKSKKLVMVGYQGNSSKYRVYDPD